MADREQTAFRLDAAVLQALRFVKEKGITFHWGENGNAEFVKKSRGWATILQTSKLGLAPAKIERENSLGYTSRGSANNHAAHNIRTSEP